MTGKVSVTTDTQKSPAKPISQIQMKPQLSSPKSSFSRSSAKSISQSSGHSHLQPHDKESRLKIELLEQKLLKESLSIVPVLENEIYLRETEIERALILIERLKAENQRLKKELEEERRKNQDIVKKMEDEIAELKKTESDRLNSNSEIDSERFQRLIEVSIKSNLISNLKKRNEENREKVLDSKKEAEAENPNNSKELAEFIKSPPKQRCIPAKPISPPPPPPPPRIEKKLIMSEIRRVPEVVEFYHSMMRRDSRKDCVNYNPSSSNARDMIGEIENRSAYLVAIKMDVETKGEFIKLLIKEVENAAFKDIEDVVTFVKLLDDELSYLVDERAVLKHFKWPEQKADALREAAFGYSDLKKLGLEASSFCDDGRQPHDTTLKKMQALLEKLEHGVYNLCRMRESAIMRYKGHHIPMDWMLDSGIVSQIKHQSLKLAVKYLKRVSAELDSIYNCFKEEQLIIQVVRFAFQVHQFAGGFDTETIRAFQELRVKIKSRQKNSQLKVVDMSTTG